MPFENVNLIPIYISLGIGALLVVLALWKKVLTIPATITAFVVLVLSALFTSYTGLVVFSVSFISKCSSLGCIQSMPSAKAFYAKESASVFSDSSKKYNQRTT
jgi:uncharacterized membrane protein